MMATEVATDTGLLTLFSLGRPRPTPPLAVIFCPSLKKSNGNLYLKIPDFSSQLFVADATMNKKNLKILVLPSLRVLVFGR